MQDEKDNGRREIETFFHRKRPALRHAGEDQLVKKSAQEGDMHKKQPDSAGKPIYNGRLAGKVVDEECRGSDQKVHGVDTRHTVFEVLFKPVFGQLKIIVIPEGDQKARQHEKDGYPDMELKKETLDKMGETFVERVFIMRYKYQVCRQRAYACKGRYIILLLPL
jgi:hypothetical protein